MHDLEPKNGKVIKRIKLRTKWPRIKLFRNCVSKIVVKILKIISVIFVIIKP